MRFLISVRPPGVDPGRAHPQGNENAGWLETVLLTATDLVKWSKLICFVSVPDLTSCEIAACLYRVRHMATHSPTPGIELHVGIDRTWR